MNREEMQKLAMNLEQGEITEEEAKRQFVLMTPFEQAKYIEHVESRGRVLEREAEEIEMFVRMRNFRVVLEGEGGPEA